MAKRDGKGFITELGENEVIVVGTNLRGLHGGGAARTAKELFGAEDGVGEGMTGQCYAFPTLDRYLRKRPVCDLWESADRFRAYANSNPHLTFLLTKVGCGIAGYPEGFMRSLFADMPPNVVQPEGWERRNYS